MALVVRNPYAGLWRHGWFPEVRPNRASWRYGTLIEAWRPNIEVAQEEGRITYKVALPDVKPGNIDITTHDGRITFSASREHESRVERKGYEFSHKSSSSFSRTLPLPPGAEWEKAEAGLEEGVLTVTVPVSEPPETEVRHIPVAVTGEPAKAGTEESPAEEPEPGEPKPAA